MNRRNFLKSLLFACLAPFSKIAPKPKLEARPGYRIIVRVAGNVVSEGVVWDVSNGVAHVGPAHRYIRLGYIDGGWKKTHVSDNQEDWQDI